MSGVDTYRRCTQPSPIPQLTLREMLSPNATGVRPSPWQRWLHQEEARPRPASHTTTMTIDTLIAALSLVLACCCCCSCSWYVLLRRLFLFLSCFLSWCRPVSSVRVVLFELPPGCGGGGVRLGRYEGHSPTKAQPVASPTPPSLTSPPPAQATTGAKTETRGQVVHLSFHPTLPLPGFVLA